DVHGVKQPRGAFRAEYGRHQPLHVAAHRNCTPCASGRSSPQFTVFVWRRMYAFHASEPDSRPPPVSFSPPNAPPISAPLVPMFTLAMPQSDPSGERNFSAARMPSVKIAELSPWSTALFH